MFKKRTTLIQNMTYMGIMAAINFVLLFLSNFIPGFLFLVIFILPLSSSIITIFCQKKYFIIYAITSFALCILANIPDTLFYVLPSICTGFIFGILIEKNYPAFYIIIFVSIIQLILTYLSLLIFKGLTNRDLIFDIFTLLNLQNWKYFKFIEYLILFFLSLIQEIITYLVLSKEINKFYKNNNEKEFLILELLSIPLLLVIEIILLLTLKEFVFLFFGIIICFTIYILFRLLLTKKKWIIVSSILSFIVTFFLSSGLYSYILQPFQILLWLIFSLLVWLILFINTSLIAKKEIIK